MPRFELAPKAETTQHETAQLAPFIPQVIDQDNPIDHIVLPDIREELPVIAEISAGKKDFKLIDVRGSERFTVPFAVVDDEYDGVKGFKGIRPETETHFGRLYLGARFSYPQTVSRNHFTVMLGSEGDLAVTDQGSTSGTKITCAAPESQLQNIDEGSRTVKAVGRIASREHYGVSDETAPYGYYFNYPIIGTQSKTVAGGVYLGGGSREAIVVDDKSNIVGASVKNLIDGHKRNARNQETQTPPMILRSVLDAVLDTIEFDESAVERIIENHRNDEIVTLSNFVKERVGVCRHMGLLASLMIEKLDSEAILLGSSNVRRNSVPGEGAHAWAEYSSPGSSSVIVVDPAQKFVGTYEQASKQGLWPYHARS